MGYKTIVVSLNDVERAGAVLGVAANVAARYDAHVIGLYVIPAVQVYPAIAMQITPEIMDSQRQYYEDRAIEVKTLFDQTLASKSISHEWRQVDALGSLIADEVIAHGRSADLVIAGQVDPDGESLVEVDLCERILMETGRPLLAVPSAGEFTAVATHVTIAWSMSREAARSVFDALPLLREAQQTIVLRVNPPEEEGALGSDITKTLKRHGVNAEYHTSVVKDISVGDEILSRISDYGSDLVVMGGYGHSRMRELFFGGATRDILHHMTVPVLISH